VTPDIPCFVCGKPMISIYGMGFGWKCHACDVIEERPPEVFISRVRTVAKATWFGDVTYLDHGAGDYPSPALNSQVRGMPLAARRDFVTRLTVSGIWHRVSARKIGRIFPREGRERMALIKKIASLPPQAQSTALKLAAIGFGEGSWYYNPNHDLADPAMGMQVRDDEERAPKKRVAHYAEVMKPFVLNRDQLGMPPVVFSADEYLLDGWTRTEAARNLDWMTYPAIVLLDSYENAPEALLDKFAMAAGMLNLTHGTPLSTADTERLILRVSKGVDLSSPGAAADLAKKLQVSRSWVINLLNARTANERAAVLDVDLSKATTITRTHMADYGNWRDKLTNPVFKDLLELTRDAKLSTTEHRIIARQVFACATEQEKLALIASERASRDGMISGHHGRPSDAAQLRQALGKVTKFKTNPGRAVETIAGGSGRHVEVIDDAIAILYTIRSEQVKMDKRRELAARAG